VSGARAGLASKWFRCGPRLLRDRCAPVVCPAPVGRRPGRSGPPRTAGPASIRLPPGHAPHRRPGEHPAPAGSRPGRGCMRVRGPYPAAVLPAGRRGEGGCRRFRAWSRARRGCCLPRPGGPGGRRPPPAPRRPGGRGWSSPVRGRAGPPFSRFGGWGGNGFCVRNRRRRLARWGDPVAGCLVGGRAVWVTGGCPAGGTALSGPGSTRCRVREAGAEYAAHGSHEVKQ
jgi:hypothetical protein